MTEQTTSTVQTLEGERIGECRGCHKPVIFVENNNTGKAQPVDVAPVANGNIVPLATRNARGTRIMKMLRKGEEHAGPKYLSHFVTCPQRASFKR